MQFSLSWYPHDKPRVYAACSVTGRWITIECDDSSATSFFPCVGEVTGDEQIKKLIAQLETLLPAPAEPVAPALMPRVALCEVCGYEGEPDEFRADDFTHRCPRCSSKFTHTKLAPVLSTQEAIRAMVCDPCKVG